jgi:hypothetical protein
MVVKHAPHLVTDVIDGKVKLDNAYTLAQANEREKKWHDDGFAMLRKQDKDLAQKVADRELTFDEARKQIDQEKRDRAALHDANPGYLSVFDR